MATGFTFMLNDVEKDFNDVFESRGTATAIDNTGFQKSDGTDFASIFLSGNSEIITGFQNSGGTDLGSLFARKPSTPFSVIGATKYTTTTTGTPDYMYATFEDTTASTKSIQILTNATLYVVCVGGGGGGAGGTETTLAPSGGGGGGIYSTSFMANKGDTYTITVGVGGSRGYYSAVSSSYVTSGSGGESLIKNGSSTILRCTGGLGGDRTNSTWVNGVEGGYAYNADNIVIADTGGGGGGRYANGQDSAYNNTTLRTLNIPLVIRTKESNIQSYYSGGGGGSKRVYLTPSTDKNPGGGAGSGSTTVSTGKGGIKSSEGSRAVASNGVNATWYGGGGGAGGASQYGVGFPGGNGGAGIVIVWMQI